MAKRKPNIVEDLYFMMRGVNSDALYPTLEQLTDTELTDRDGRTVLIEAAFCGRIDVVQYLLSHGAKVNVSDNNGYTALHASVQENHYDIAKLLLENGADVNARDVFGNPPIWRIKKHYSQVFFELLLNNGADIHTKNAYGMSIAEIWISSNYPDFVKPYCEKKQ